MIIDNKVWAFSCRPCLTDNIYILNCSNLWNVSDGSEEEYEDGDDESEHSEGDTVASDLGGQSSSEHSEDDCASSEVEPLEQDSDQSEPEESERHSTTGDDTLSAAGTPMKVLQRRLQKELERAGKAKKGIVIFFPLLVDSFSFSLKGG